MTAAYLLSAWQGFFTNALLGINECGEWKIEEKQVCQCS